MEVRCAALRMKYQEENAAQQFHRDSLDFFYAPNLHSEYIKTKDEKIFFLLLYFYLIPILFCLINLSTLLKVLSKNQDLLLFFLLRTYIRNISR